MTMITMSLLLLAPAGLLAQEPAPASPEARDAEKQARIEFLEQERQSREQERQVREQERDSWALFLDKEELAEMQVEMKEYLDSEELKELQREMQSTYRVFSEDMKEVWVDVQNSMPDKEEINDLIIMSNEYFMQHNQTRLTLRNTFNGGSESTTGNFDVEADSRYFKCTISGKVREGEINITLYYPGGKVFKEFTIDSSAEITFSQSISFQEGNSDKYIGSWEYEIEAKEAIGHYSLSVSNN